VNQLQLNSWAPLLFCVQTIRSKMDKKYILDLLTDYQYRKCSIKFFCHGPTVHGVFIFCTCHSQTAGFLGLCHQQQFRGAILSASHPSVKVHYIGTRNVQLMHCSGCDFCWRLGDIQREIEGVRSGEGLGPWLPGPLPNGGLGACPTENMKIYINADAVQNWRKYVHDGVANPL